MINTILSAPEEPTRPVLEKVERIFWITLFQITILIISLAFYSCTTSRYLLTESIDTDNISNKSSSYAFAQLLRLTIAKMPEMHEKDLIRALSDAAAIQTADTLPVPIYSKISNHISLTFRDNDRKAIVGLLLDFMSFRYGDVKRRLADLTLEVLSKNGAMAFLPILKIRLGDSWEAKLWQNIKYQQHGIDALLPLRRRALNYYSIIGGNTALSLLSSVHSQSKLTMNEAKQLIPLYLKINNFVSLRHILMHAPEFYLDSAIALSVLTNWANLKYSSSKTDSLVFAYISSFSNVSENYIADLANLVCENDLRMSALALTRYISNSNTIAGRCLLKLGWLLYSESSDMTNKIWKLALNKLDTSSYEFKSTQAYVNVIDGNDSISRSLLRSVIVQFPQEILPRKVYLEFLLNDFDLSKLSYFLKHAKESLDSITFQENFGEIYTKCVLAKLLGFYSWQNSKGIKYWIYEDTSKTAWLYDSYFEPLNTSMFVNRNNDIMLWVFENGREYLFREDNSYANQYRFKNSEGRYVYAIIEDGYTFYYDSDYKWTGYKSYTNKNGKDIYIKSVENYEYYYNDSLEYMNIYSYRTKEGRKMFVKKSGSLQVYHDSTWTPTGLIGFSSNPSLYAFIYQDNAKLYYYNEYVGLISLNVTVYKNSQNQIFIEDGDAFRDYYNINGEYLEWSIWMNDGKIGSISVPYKGKCRQFYAGSTDLTDCLSYSRQKANLFSQKEYLNKSIITDLASLFYGQSKTPYEIFASIAREIEKRKNQEITLAILQGINQGLESYNNSMQSYRNKTYSNPYSTYTITYQSNSSYSTNSYSNYSKKYSNTFSNSYSSDSYSPTQRTKYFSYSDSYGTNLNGSSRSIGRFQYTDVYGNNGYSGSATSYNIGKFNYVDYSDNQGTYGHGTSYSIGNFDYYDYNDNKGNRLSGNFHRIGNFDYFSGRDNNMNTYLGTSQKIGNFIYHDMTTSDGKRASGTTYKIGNTIYTDWNISK